MADVLWHGDGCDTPMAGTTCPRCLFAPSMQDTFFAPADWKPSVAPGHQAGTAYKPGDRIVVTNHEMTVNGQRGCVEARQPYDVDHHVRVRLDDGQAFTLHQNDVKPVDLIERIGALE